MGRIGKDVVKVFIQIICWRGWTLSKIHSEMDQIS